MFDRLRKGEERPMEAKRVSRVMDKEVIDIGRKK